MTKTIHYCDRCGEEVPFVVGMPEVYIEINEFKVWGNKCELCRECAERAVAAYSKALCDSKDA